jgi:hypothetical protein
MRKYIDLLDMEDSLDELGKAFTKFEIEASGTIILDIKISNSGTFMVKFKGVPNVVNEKFLDKEILSKVELEWKLRNTSLWKLLNEF